MNHKTKIVATIGPSSESEAMIGKLIDAGTNLFRLNIKYNAPEWHSKIIRRIRSVAAEKKACIGIIMDLQGPEICIGSFKSGKISLNPGSRILITASGNNGDRTKIILKNKQVLKSLKPSHKFYMDDGNLEFEAVSNSKKGVIAQVIKGGVLFDGKSVNLPDTILTGRVLTESDMKYISLGTSQKVDFFAISFVRNAKDAESLRRILARKKCPAKIIAKIESQQAIDNFTEILAASDAIMIGRGDLGVEIPLPTVPLIQKEIIHKCRLEGKQVITATQMLESMIKSPIPTRAEVSDVANAILDGTDAIMLSAESATGDFPLDAVKMMAEIDRSLHRSKAKFLKLPHKKPNSLIEALSQAVDTLSCNPLDFKAIILLTETGRTARMIARFRPEQPIYAVTQTQEIANQLALVWGARPIMIKFMHKENEKIFNQIISEFKKEKHLLPGDKVICVSGQIVGRENLTNSVIVNTVK